MPTAKCLKLLAGPGRTHTTPFEKHPTELFPGSVVPVEQAEARASATDFSRGTCTETLLNRNKEREKLEATSAPKPALGVGFVVKAMVAARIVDGPFPV